MPEERKRSDVAAVALWVVLAAAAAIFLFCSFFAVQKPFNLDEGDFASGAHYAGLTGKPVFFIGQEVIKDLYDLELFSVEKHLGYALWHPPLYINTLALWFKAFGETTVTGRLFGLFLSLFSLFLCLMIIREICAQEEISRERRFFISGLAVILYLVNPLILQFSLLLDIDSSILPPLVLLFFYGLVKNRRRESLKGDIVLGFFFGVTLLAKLSTPPLILPSVFLFYFLSGRFRQAFQKTFIIGLVGGLFFLGVWSAYAALLRLPFDFFFDYNYGTKVLPNAGRASLFVWPFIGISALFYALWVSPAFLGLSGAGAAVQLGQSVKTRKATPLSLFFLFCLFVLALYIVFYPRRSMMKYSFVSAPFFILVTAFFMAKYVRNMTLREIVVYGVAGALALATEFFFVPDVLISASNLHFLGQVIPGRTLGLYFAPLLVLSFVPSLLLAGSLKARHFFIGLMVSALVYNVALDLKQTAPYTTTNDWFNYGEEGLKETIDYLDRNLGPEGAIMCRKDVGYYLKELKGRPGLRWYSVDNCLNYPGGQAAEFFKKFAQEDDIQFVEIDRQAVRTPYLPDILSDLYSLDKEFGSFRIYRKKR